MPDSDGNQIHYRKGTKVIVVHAFDGKLYCCINNKDVYALDLISEREEKSKHLDLDYQKPKKSSVPAMNHPWQRMTFGKFVKQQKHHMLNESA